MSQGGLLNEQGLYTFRALAEQAQDPNFDVAQVMHHLQANMAAMKKLRQQLGNLQNLVQEQAQHPNQAAPAPSREEKDVLVSGDR
jgi:citrate synthase